METKTVEKHTNEKKEEEKPITPFPSAEGGELGGGGGGRVKLFTSEACPPTSNDPCHQYTTLLLFF